MPATGKKSLEELMFESPGTEEADAAADSMEVEEEVAGEQQIFALDILLLTHTAQTHNGLRHGDYDRYRQYCSRRLRRVRKSVGLNHPKVGWQGNAVKTNMVTDARVLTIPLLLAERAWSYAMKLKNEMEDETDRKNFHLRKRFKRASEHSRELVELCALCTDQRTQLEAEAYSSLMQANMLFQSDSPDSLEKFVHAKMAYEELAKLSGSEVRAMCVEKVSSIEPSIRYCKYMMTRTKGKGADIEFLRGVQEGEFGDLLSSKVASIVAESRIEEAMGLDRVSWRGQPVPVLNEKVRVAVVGAREVLKQIAGAGGRMNDDNDDVEQDAHGGVQELYQQLFRHYEDAMQAIRTDIRDMENERKKKSRAEVQLNQLKLLKDYIAYSKLAGTRERNLALAWTLADTLKEQEHVDAVTQKSQRKVKADEIVHLFEKLLDSLREQVDLLDAPNDAVRHLDDAGNPVEAEETKEEKRKLSHLESCYRAGRSFFLAESFRKFSKWEEASALFSSCADRITAMQSQNKNGGGVDERLTELKALAETRQYVLRAAAYLSAEAETTGVAAVLQQTTLSGEQKGATEASTVRGQTLLDKLDQYLANEQLVPFPPNFQATPCKPVLFDLALNHIDPSVVDISKRLPKRKNKSSGNEKKQGKQAKTQQHRQHQHQKEKEQEQEQPQSSGWFGGWLG